MIAFFGLQEQIFRYIVLIKVEREGLSNELSGMVRDIIGNFKLAYVKCSLETCEKRDVEGMYKKARKSDIHQFTGISAPFEEPTAPDIIVDTENNNPKDCVKQMLEAMRF